MDDVTDKILENFYNGFNDISPIKLMLFMILSFGIYFINWIYLLNLRFKKSGLDFVPNPLQGLRFMFLVPFSWLVVMGVLKKIYTLVDPIFLFWIDVVGWIIIMIMMLEYMYRFCICFGKFTSTNGIIWYLFLWVGFFPLVLIPFEKYFFLPILLFPLFTIPAMQAKLNYDYNKYYGL